MVLFLFYSLIEKATAEKIRNLENEGGKSYGKTVIGMFWSIF